MSFITYVTNYFKFQKTFAQSSSSKKFKQTPSRKMQNGGTANNQVINFFPKEICAKYLNLNLQA